MQHDDEIDEIELQALLAKAKQLPREVAPAPESWTQIHDRIEATRVRALAPVADVDTGATLTFQAPAPVNVHPWYRSSRVVLAIAATLFIAVTALVVTRDRMVGESSSQVANAPDSLPQNDAKPSASISAVLAQYDEATSDLTKDLEQRRPRLQPEAVAVLDSCLTTIDRAIQESRTALQETPENTTIAELLQFTYQQKLDLLRRASELPAASF